MVCTLQPKAIHHFVVQIVNSIQHFLPIININTLQTPSPGLPLGPQGPPPFRCPGRECGKALSIALSQSDAGLGSCLRLHRGVQHRSKNNKAVTFTAFTLTFTITFIALTFTITFTALHIYNIDNTTLTFTTLHLQQGSGVLQLQTSAPACTYKEGHGTCPDLLGRQSNGHQVEDIRGRRCKRAGRPQCVPKLEQHARKKCSPPLSPPLPAKQHSTAQHSTARTQNHGNANGVEASP